jgi:glycogen debranching enzyme
MTISLDRNLCCDLQETISREWLVTNGLGGYAAGTVAGVLTRKQHGLFVTTPPNAVTPQLLLAKIDEEVIFDQRTYYLGTNEYRDGILNPSGFVHLETFRLEAGFPIFTYRLGGIDGIVLEKRIWMVRGYNTTYIQYRVLPTETASQAICKRTGTTGALHQNTTGLLTANTQDTTHSSLTLTLLPLTAYRPIDRPQHGNLNYQFQVQMHGSVGNETDMERETLAQQDFNRQTHLPAGVAGCTIRAYNDAYPYHLLAVGSPQCQATFIPTGVWYWNFIHRHDGPSATDDLYLPGVIRATLYPEEHSILTIVVSTEELDAHLYRRDQIAILYKESLHYQDTLVQQVLQPAPKQDNKELLEHRKDLHSLPLTSNLDLNSGDLDYLLYAKEHFLVQYPVNQGSKRSITGQGSQHLHSGPPFTQQEPDCIILAEYFNQENRTRDALIALPGLLLVNERFAEARRYLLTLAGYFVNGTLPERIPLAGQALTDADYRSADIPLWYCYALDAYLRSTQDNSLLEEVFPTLKEWIQYYLQGTYKGIHVEPYEGLLCAEKAGQALTWMNAYHNGKPVTPRAGKPVEVNALWYNALRLMAEWSEQLEQYGHIGQNATPYRDIAERCREHFHQRFWNVDRGYLYDVVDGPTGNDSTLRVNQLFALSLRHPVLDHVYHQRILDVITQSLVTPLGLRTLSPDEKAYHGQLMCNSKHGVVLDPTALHQGAVWSWLVGPYIDAIQNQWQHKAREHDTNLLQKHLWQKGMHILEPLKERFHVTLLGMCEGIFPGDGPVKLQQQLGLQLASAITTGELLRSYTSLTKMRTQRLERAILY